MSGELSAFIPAGGLGSRLHPHTLETPKPLMLMGQSDRRIIDDALELTHEACNNTWVSVDYMSEKMSEYLANKPEVSVLHDSTTKGSGGSLIEHFDELSDLDPDGNLVILPSDHLHDGNFSLTDYASFHNEHGANMTLLTVPRKSYGEYAALYPSSTSITSIETLPKFGTVSTTGTYMFKNRFILDILHKARHDESELNIYRDIVCPQVGRMAVASYFVSAQQGYWEDMGTPSRYLLSNMRLSHGRNVIDPSASIANGAELRRCVVMGHVSIHSGLQLEDAIITATKAGELYITQPFVPGHQPPTEQEQQAA